MTYIAKWRNGTVVRLKKDVRWHGLHIPKGKAGVVVKAEGRSALVRFDMPLEPYRYGSFVCWAAELIA